MYQCQCVTCGGIFMAENKRSCHHETITDCIKTFRGNITALESELAALKAKLPGPMDVVVTVPEAVRSESITHFYWCNYKCPRLGTLSGCDLEERQRSPGEIWLPGPLCPAYRLMAFKAAWFFATKFIFAR